MRRTPYVLAVVAALSVVWIPTSAAFAAPAVAAPAAQVCEPPIDYPPTPPGLNGKLKVTDLALAPGTSTGTVTVSGAEPGAGYSGTVRPAAIDLPATVASSAGVVRFTGLAVPAGLRVPSLHQISVLDSCGRVVSFEVCITGAGSLGAIGGCSAASANQGAAGSLARTGWDPLDVLRMGIVALGLGAFLLYLRRRAVHARSA